MMEKIGMVLITIMNAALAIGLIAGMGIAMTIASIIDETPFGVFVGIVLIAMGVFAFALAQHDTVYALADTKEES